MVQKKERSYNDILKNFEDAFENSITTNPPAFQALVPVLRGSMVELDDKLGTEQVNTLVSNGTYENALVDVKKGYKFIPRISALRLFLFVSHEGNPKVFIDTNIETPLNALRKVRDLLSQSISPEDQIFHHIYSMLNPSKWDKPSTGLEEFFCTSTGNVSITSQSRGKEMDHIKRIFPWWCSFSRFGSTSYFIAKLSICLQLQWTPSDIFKRN